MYVYAPQNVPGAHRGQKRVSDILELELWMVVGPMWVLGTELKSSVSTTTLKC